MLGVDEFRSTEQARVCQEKATRRLERVQKLFLPTAILSVVSFFLLEFGGKGFIWDALAVIVLAGVAAVYFFSEAWYYIGKLLLLPFRKLGKILGLIVFLFYFAPCALVITFLPVVVLVYERYLCNITLECAKDIV